LGRATRGLRLASASASRHAFTAATYASCCARSNLERLLLKVVWFARCHGR
jgi:hypothetical protein